MAPKRNKRAATVQPTRAAKMIKKDKSTANKIVKDKEDNDGSSPQTDAGVHANRLNCEPRRSSKEFSRGKSVNPKSGRTEKEKNEGKADKISSVDVDLPKKNKELANLVVNMGTGEIIIPKTPRSERKIHAAVKIDDEPSLSQHRRSTSRPVRKGERSDNVSMLVKTNKSLPTSPNPNSILQNNTNVAGQSSSKAITRARSTAKSTQRSADKPIVATSDAISSTSAVKSPLIADSSRRKTVDSSQSSALRLYKNGFSDDDRLIVSDDGTLPTLIKPYSIFEKSKKEVESQSRKKRAQSTPRSIPKPPSTIEVVAVTSDSIPSTSTVAASHKTNTRRSKSVKPSRNEIDSAPLSMKEECNDTISLIVHPHGSPLASPRTNPILKKNKEAESHYVNTHEQSASQIIQKRKSTYKVVDEPSAIIISTPSTETSQETTSGRPSQSGPLINLRSTDNISSALENNHNDSSSVDDFNLNTERRKSNGAVKSDSECESGTVARVSYDNNSDSGAVSIISIPQPEKCDTIISTPPNEVSPQTDGDNGQKICYKSKPMEYIVEKMANKHPDAVCLVWTKKLSMDLASAVARSGQNCILIVKKFNAAYFCDVVNLSKMLCTCSVDVEPDAQSLRLFAFGGLALPKKIVHKGGFKSLTNFEAKMKKFASSQGTELVNIFKYEESTKGWYNSLKNSLKEDCIIARMI